MTGYTAMLAEEAIETDRAEAAVEARYEAAKEKERVTVKIGDVFVASWGYDQTNINYEQVVGVTASGKSVYVKPIHFKAADDGRRVVADVGNFKRGRWDGYGEFKDTTQRKVIRSDPRFYDGHPYFKWASFADAVAVDPTIPQYDTIAAGEPGH